MKNAMTVSIVIPTYNGGREFEQCLKAVYGQKVDFPFEVILVDSGSTDETLSIAGRFPVRLYEISKGEFNHGLTRNKGIELSRGEFVVLMTQDAIPADEKWLENLTKPFWEDEMVAGVYARQIPREDADVLTKRHLNRWLTARRERDIKYITDRSYYEKLSPMEKYKFCNFDDVCSCIRKSVWEKIPFEEASFAEDLDWSKKVIESGFKIVYEPFAAVIHSHDRSVLYEYKRTYVCHRRLNELFGLRTVPALRHVVRSTKDNIIESLLYVWRNEPVLEKRLFLILRIPFFSLLSVYGQYRGAKDQLEKRKIKGMSGV
jgi:rhamnosyltransferase